MAYTSDTASYAYRHVYYVMEYRAKLEKAPKNDARLRSWLRDLIRSHEQHVADLADILIIRENSK